MAEVATTRMSSKGQVVIPESVRQRLRLKAGDQFTVLGEGDVIVLKAIEAPSMANFDDLVREARRQARSSGLKRADIADAVASARGKR